MKIEGDPYFKLRPPPATPDDEICQCCESKAIKLMSALSFNPIHCIDCNLEVAPETLGLEASVVDGIAYWQSIFGAIDQLWLASDEYEAWAALQLSNIGSAVNRVGLEAAQSVNRVFGGVTTGFFRNNPRRVLSLLTICPLCQSEFTLYSQGIFPQFRCESCKIITVAE